MQRSGDGLLEAIISSEDGFVHSIDISTRRIDWSFRLGSRGISSPALADVDSDGQLEVVAVSSDDGTIYLLDGAEVTVEASAEILPPQVMVHVTISVDPPMDLAISVLVEESSLEEISSAKVELSRSSPSSEIDLALTLDPGLHNLHVKILAPSGNPLAFTLLEVEVPAPEQPEGSGVSSEASNSSSATLGNSESKRGMPMILLALFASLSTAAVLLALKKIKLREALSTPAQAPSLVETRVYGEETEVYDVEAAAEAETEAAAGQPTVPGGPTVPGPPPPAPAPTPPGSLVLDPVGLSMTSARAVSASDVGAHGEGRLAFARLPDGWYVEAMGVDAELNGVPLREGERVRLSDGDVIRAWGVELRVLVR